MNFSIFYVLTKWVRSPKGGGSDSFNIWIVRVHTLGLPLTQIMIYYKQKLIALVRNHNHLIKKLVQFH